MKKKNLSKLIALCLLSLSLTSISSKEANAAWIKDRNGWWYTEGNSWATGWRYINGLWYYFNSQGYMVTNTVVDGYYVNSNGEWVPSYTYTPTLTPTQPTSDNTKVEANTTLQPEVNPDNIPNDISNTITPSTNSSTDIGQEKAKQIALAHAGVSSNNLPYLKSNIDYEFGYKTYEVHFQYKNIHYDYDIDSLTGKVLRCNKNVDDYFEIDDDKINSPQDNSTLGDIGLEKAKQIALNNAGVSLNSIRHLKIDLDYDDGIKIYEIDFKVGNMEYEYEINASTGEIEKYDREYDD